MRRLSYSERIRIGRIVLLVGIIIFLEIVGQARIFNTLTYVPPSTMVASAIDLVLSGALVGDIISTIGLVLSAFLLSVVVGLALGWLLWRFGTLKRVLDPYLIVVYAMPIFVFYPILIVIFGLGKLPIVLIAFAMGVTIVIISTANGLAKVPTVYLNVGRSLNLSKAKQFRYIIFPAAVPYIFTGLKLGFVYAFIGVIASEFILSNEGLGYMVSWYYENFITQNMYAALIVVIVLAVTINLGLIRLEDRLHRRT